ncbi:MAG: 23S rRNA (uracil(1939)-C(5))-methyltransferase RlmD [Clostridiales bacterium]|nr:23S rRNA (uracil(1939)-C(5))-methyltransferase RlmD [Clostridiales bacterium]
MKKNDVLELTILRLSGEQGIAVHEGLTVFVRNALPGERVMARIERVQKNCAFAKAVDILQPSPARREPLCPYYEKCGGCVCQHMTYDMSLDMKRERVRDALVRIGHVDVQVPPVLGMENPWHYRNKTSLPVGGETGDLKMGYYAPRSHRIVDIDKCLIAMEESDEVLRVVRSWMQKFSVQPYNEITHQGVVRHVMSRVSRQRQVMAVIVSTQKQLPHERELVAMLRSGVEGLASVCVSVNKRGDNVILGDNYHVLWGESRLHDTLCGFDFALSPLSFFQVNPVQTEKLYHTAVDFAALSGNELVADLYCGAGTISLLLSRHAQKVIGIEIVEPAIRDAEENARRNGVTNVEFHAAAAEKLLPDMVEKGLRPDVVVLDPPRKGCEESVLRAIIKASPRRVVYVSCDVATQARDAVILTQGGYRATRCQSVDMFCHTGHVENVLLFEKE